jgi:GT2 family glycosyltransferase
MDNSLLSICIVTFQAREYLRNCLLSIQENPPSCSREIIVVDNHSTDGTLEMLAAEFPTVQVIVNSENRGFTAPTNQALQCARGDYLTLLNPDTIVHPGALDGLIRFLEAHPAVGVCGPRVLNVDGSLQKPCRRGEPRPFAVFSYFLGLSRLFPNNRLFGGYLLDYMGEDETYPVDGVSGSCMFIRRAVIDQIGYLDERFFAYQEDADYCFRARQAGWQVFYVADARITHYGGQGGSRVQPYRSILAWHHSYWLYYRKNLARDYFFLFNWLYYLAMLAKLGISLLVNMFRQEKFVGQRRPG